MIVGIGADVVDLARFGETLRRTPSVRERLFTPAEAVLPVDALAARFAAKEALAKALGAPGGLAWHDAEVVAGTGGPRLRLRGSVASRAGALGVARTRLVLSQDAGAALALVVLESPVETVAARPPRAAGPAPGPEDGALRESRRAGS